MRGIWHPNIYNATVSVFCQKVVMGHISLFLSESIKLHQLSNKQTKAQIFISMICYLFVPVEEKTVARGTYVNLDDL